MKGMVGAMVLVTLLWVAACERLTQPRLGSEALALQELSTLVTETYLKLEGIERFSRGTLKLYRNGKALWERTLTLADTVLYDSTLQPAQRYTYRAELWADNRRLAQSAPVTVTTMDTTSHAFEWEVIEFPSPYGSGALYDVAIIDENNIWAVGEIYSDSTQPWLPYNAVHWDGEKWELKRITYDGIPWPIKTIFAFAEDDIWFEAFVRWNGELFVELSIPDVLVGVGINKMWGTSSDDLYIVGNNGLIAHYDGRSWRRIESGVAIEIRDIWGVNGHENDIWDIIAVASEDIFHGDNISVLSISGNEVKILNSNSLSIGIQGVWSCCGLTWYISGFGIYRKRLLDNSWQQISEVPEYYFKGIRGCDENNIFIVSTSGVVGHWNGINWQIFPRFSARLLDLAVTEKMIVAVGNKSNGFVIGSAMIVIGRRR